MKLSIALLTSALLTTTIATPFGQPAPGSAAELQKRSKLGVNCISNYGYARAGDVQRGIDNIRGWGNIPIYVGGHSCARLSCIDKSGITLCNDNDGHIAPLSDYISSYAWDIVNACGRQTGGQEFDSDNYNVIVGSC